MVFEGEKDFATKTTTPKRRKKTTSKQCELGSKRIELLENAPEIVHFRIGPFLRIVLEFF